jgi:hypothetical protein
MKQKYWIVDGYKGLRFLSEILELENSLQTLCIVRNY